MRQKWKSDSLVMKQSGPLKVSSWKVYNDVVVKRIRKEDFENNLLER